MRVPVFAILTLQMLIGCCLLAGAHAAENTGKVQQPVIAGNPVDIATQKELGLVTVGGCSGTLLNSYWVLTADHCVAADASIGGPSAALANLGITGGWSKKIVTPTRLVRNWGPNPPGSGLDVALIFLGTNDFGPMNVQLLYVDRIDHDVTIRAYGRGIYGYASGSGPTATPALLDGKFRSADFRPATSDSTKYAVLPRLGQVPAWGDSGGPDRVVTPDGQVLGITGVHSVGAATGYVPDKPQSWMWATGVAVCTSAAIVGIREEIIDVVRPERVAFCKDYASKAVTAARQSQELACGFDGPRWSADAGAHLDWCMAMNGDQGPPNAETAARAGALEPCREQVALRGQIDKKPAIPVGDLTTPVTPPPSVSKPSGGTGKFLDQMKP